MTERRGDPGFSVAPQRIGDGPPGPRRRRVRGLGIAATVAAAAAIVAIAWIGPRLSDRPNLDLSFFATPTPATTATPTPAATETATPGPTAGSTPLPEITRPGPPSAGDPIAIIADGLRILDLGTDHLEKAADAAIGLDAVVRAPDGRGWTCICFVDDLASGDPVRIVRLTAIGRTGAERDSVDLLTLPAAFGEDDPVTDPLTDVDVGADGRRGLLAIAHHVANGWAIRVVPIDIDRRLAGTPAALGEANAETPSPIPSPSTTASPGGAPGSPGPTARPSRTPRPTAAPTVTPAPSNEAEQPFPNAFLDGPHVRIAPGGRVAFVWAIVQTNSTDAVTSTAVHAWRVELGADGEVGATREIGGLAELPSFCGAVGFAADDRLVWFCGQFTLDPVTSVPGIWAFGSIDLEGRAQPTRDVAVAGQSGFGEPLFDRANGQLYGWDPVALRLVRIDVHTLALSEATFDPAAASAPGAAAGGGDRAPAWADSDSAVQLNSFSQIAAAPGGPRLYLVGFQDFVASDHVTQGSLGIFVVDRSSLALLDRWAPAADYLGIGTTPSGLVVAIGIPGVDADGREAPWEGSITVHDPADGRIVVRYGRLGQGFPPVVLPR